jgi:hypothetical protein
MPDPPVIQTPPTAKHPLAISMPFVKVEDAVEVTARLSALTLPENVPERFEFETLPPETTGFVMVVDCLIHDGLLLAIVDGHRLLLVAPY